MPVIANTEVPGFLCSCSDPEVRAFCVHALWDFNPHGNTLPLSGPELFQAARRRFGDYRCLDLEYWLH